MNKGPGWDSPCINIENVFQEKAKNYDQVMSEPLSEPQEHTHCSGLCLGFLPKQTTPLPSARAKQETAGASQLRALPRI